MEQLKISIIIPVYNVEKYIARCLDSILNQTFQDFEIVIVNDATPDRSMDIVKEYQKRDGRIRIFSNEQNMGLMWTRMIGYTNAKGDYFMFCDSDDFYPSNALELLYNAIVRDGADIAIGNHQKAYVDNKFGDKSNYKLAYGDCAHGLYKSLLKGEVSHSLCGKIYKKELFTNHKYDAFENFTNGEDAILFYQLVDNISKVTLINEVVYYYFSNSTSSSNIRLNNNAIKNIFKAQYLIQSLVANDQELSELFDAKNSKSILLLLKNGYDKKMIIENSIIDIGKYFKYKTINGDINGIFNALFAYSIMNSRLIRENLQLVYKLKSRCFLLYNILNLYYATTV